MNTEAEIPFFQCDNIGKRIPCRYGDAAVGQIIGTRKRQEDACAGGSVQFQDGSIQDIIILADGMGGHNDGNAASKTVICAFIEAVKGLSARRTPPSPDELYVMQRSILKDALAYADKKLGEQKDAGRIADDAGCTFMACMIDQSGVFSHISVGDSLMYRRAGDANAPVELINELHTVETRERKKWQEANDGSSWTSWQQQWINEHGSLSKRFWKALTQAVKGEHELKPHVKSNILQRGAVLALTSDGVLTFGGPDRLTALFRSESDAGSRALVGKILGDIHNTVNQTGKKQDNSTMVCYRFGAEAPRNVFAPDATTETAYVDRSEASAPTARRATAPTARNAAPTGPLPPATPQRKSSPLSLICVVVGVLALLVISVGLISMYFEGGSASPVAQTDTESPPQSTSPQTTEKGAGEEPAKQAAPLQLPTEAVNDGENSTDRAYKEELKKRDEEIAGLSEQLKQQEKEREKSNAENSQLKSKLEQEKKDKEKQLSQQKQAQSKLEGKLELVRRAHILEDEWKKVQCGSDSNASDEVKKLNTDKKSNLDAISALVRRLTTEATSSEDIGKIETELAKLEAAKKDSDGKYAAILKKLEHNKSTAEEKKTSESGNDATAPAQADANAAAQPDVNAFIKNYEKGVSASTYNEEARLELLKKLEKELFGATSGEDNEQAGIMRRYAAAYDKYKKAGANDELKGRCRVYMFLAAADVFLKIKDKKVSEFKNDLNSDSFAKDLDTIKEKITFWDGNSQDPRGVALQVDNYGIKNILNKKKKYSSSHVEKIGRLLEEDIDESNHYIFFLNTAYEMDKAGDAGADKNVRWLAPVFKLIGLRLTLTNAVDEYNNKTVGALTQERIKGAEPPEQPKK